MQSFKHLFIVFLTCLLCAGCTRLTLASEVTITIHVVDDDNTSIEGALIQWSWRGRSDNSPRTAKGTSDQKGDLSQVVDGAPCVIVTNRLRKFWSSAHAGGGW